MGRLDLLWSVQQDDNEPEMLVPPPGQAYEENGSGSQDKKPTVLYEFSAVFLECYLCQDTMKCTRIPVRALPAVTLTSTCLSAPCDPLPSRTLVPGFYVWGTERAETSTKSMLLCTEFTTDCDMNFFSVWSFPGSALVSFCPSPAPPSSRDLASHRRAGLAD